MGGSDRPRLVVASANPDKVAEIAAILGDAVELVPRPSSIPDVVEDGDTLEANARLKAVAISDATGLPAVADDTGLAIDALGGAPGVYAARFAGEDVTYADNVNKALSELERVGASTPAERRARFATIALVRYPDGREVVCEGVVEGTIATSPRGAGTFGYDPIFVPDEGEGRTFAEMTADEKHAISHRGRAFRKLAAALAMVVLFAVGCSSNGGGATSASSAPTASGATTTSGAPTTNGATTKVPSTGGGGATGPSARALYDAACSSSLTIKDRGTVSEKDLAELSGIVASRANPGVLWVHDDSGSDPSFFAVSDDGELLRTFMPDGASAVDWEDIAMGPAPAGGGNAPIYLADIGDNDHARPNITLYRVAEPKVTQNGTAEPRPDVPQKLTGVDTINLRYPDEVHNTEAFFVDPTTGDGVIITKEETAPAVVYTVPAAALAPGATATLQRQGTVSFGTPSHDTRVTGSDISANGDTIAVRTYGGVHLFARNDGQSVYEALSGKPCDGPKPDEEQGEAVGFATDGRSYFTISEGKNAQLHQTVPS